MFFIVLGHNNARSGNGQRTVRERSEYSMTVLSPGSARVGLASLEVFLSKGESDKFYEVGYFRRGPWFRRSFSGLPGKLLKRMKKNKFVEFLWKVWGTVEIQHGGHVVDSEAILALPSESWGVFGSIHNCGRNMDTLLHSRDKGTVKTVKRGGHRPDRCLFWGPSIILLFERLKKVVQTLGKVYIELKGDYVEI